MRQLRHVGSWKQCRLLTTTTSGSSGAIVEVDERRRVHEVGRLHESVVSVELLLTTVVGVVI